MGLGHEHRLSGGLDRVLKTTFLRRKQSSKTAWRESLWYGATKSQKVKITGVQTFYLRVTGLLLCPVLAILVGWEAQGVLLRGPGTAAPQPECRVKLVTEWG